VISFRRAEQRDRQFIVETWKDSFKTAYTAGLIAMDDWAAVMRPQIEKVLARPEIQVLVASNPEDDDPIADLMGWLAFEKLPEGPYVYFCYTKQPYRRQGIATALFRAAGINPQKPFSYACSTRVVRVLSDKIPLARWEPLIARFPPGTSATTRRSE
jgi:GNAT superfamily N-acetyltransferase